MIILYEKIEKIQLEKNVKNKSLFVNEKTLTKIGKICKMNKKGGIMKKRRSNSVQEWLPFEDILENGIIKLKNNSYIKILKVSPINFNLKSN